MLSRIRHFILNCATIFCTICSILFAVSWLWSYHAGYSWQSVEDQAEVQRIRGGYWEDSLWREGEQVWIPKKEPFDHYVFIVSSRGRLQWFEWHDWGRDASYMKADR